MATEPALDTLLGALDLLDYSTESPVYEFIHNWQLIESDPHCVDEFVQSCDNLLLFRTHQSAVILRLLSEQLGDDAIFRKFIITFITALLDLSPINRIRVYSPELCHFLISRALPRDANPEDVRAYLAVSELGICYNEMAQLYKSALASPEGLSLLYNSVIDRRDQCKGIILTNAAALHFDSLYFFDICRGFTISSWFKLHSGFTNLCEGPLTDFDLIVLKNSGQPLITYSLQDGKLCIATGNTRRKFDSFTFELERLYNIAFVHHCDNRRSSTIDLYVDGELIECCSTEPIFQDEHSSGGFSFVKHAPCQLQLTADLLGSTSNVIPEFTNLVIVNDVRSLDWILLQYGLGPLYAGTFQDTNLMFLLNPKQRMMMKLRIEEAGGPNSFYVAPHKLVLNFHCLNAEVNDTARINVQVSTIPKNHPRPLPITLENPLDGDALFYNPQLAVNSLYAVGGFGIMLRLIAESSTANGLIQSLKMLFFVLDTSPRSAKEFGSKSGYDVLATLLKTKKHLMGMDILMVILSFIGYNETSPANSVIADIPAYRSLITDFELWQPKRINDKLDPNGKDTFKFVLFQLSVFGQESKYHAYNLQKLGEMKIVRRVIQALKYRLVDEDLLPILHDSLLIIIRQNPDPDAIKAMALYVIYALKERKSLPLDKLCGISILDIIVNLVCDPSTELDRNEYKKVLKAINAKWNMILIDYKDPKVVKMALQLFLRVLALLGSTARHGFHDSGGTQVLRKCLSKSCENSELYPILYFGMLGLPYDTRDDFVQLVRITARKESHLKLVLPEISTVYNGMVATTISKLSALIKSDDYSEYDKQVLNALELLNTNMKIWDISITEVPCLRKMMRNDESWIKEAMLADLGLRMIAPLSEQISLISRRCSTMLAAIFLERIFSLSSTSRDRSWVKGIASKLNGLFSLTVAPLVFEHVVGFSEVGSYLSNYSTCTTLLELFTQYFAADRLYQFTDEDFMERLSITGTTLAKIAKKDYDARKTGTYKSCCTQLSRSLIEFLARNTEQEIKSPSSAIKQIKFCCSVFMMYQEMILGSLDDNMNGALLTLFFKNLSDPETEISGLCANCIRIFAIDLEKPARLAATFTTDYKLRKRIAVLLKQSASMNDEELKAEVCSDESFEKLISESFKETLAAVHKFEGHVSKEEYSQELLDAQLKMIMAPVPKNWNLAGVSKSIVESELRKFNRHIQDDKDDLAYYIAMYDKIRSHMPVETIAFTHYLESAEGRFRERKKIVREPVLDSLSQLMETEVFSDKSTHSSDSEVDMEISGYEFVSDKVDLDATQEDKNRKIVRSLFVHDKIVQISNVTQIFGLETLESIIILGLTNLYLIGNYFRTADGDIVDIKDATGRDQYVQTLSNSVKDTTDHLTKSWPMSDLVSISKRKFILRDVAIELFFLTGSSVLITCMDKESRNALFTQLSSKITARYTDEDLDEAMRLASKQKIPLVKSSDNTFGSMFNNLIISSNNAMSYSHASMSKITRKWRMGELSNFYYLILVNTIAGRTFNDLTQYPVFPWVIADYQSEDLDLNNPATFRDLSKPMGAQTEKRKNQFRERYEASAEMAPDIPPAHYGTHYSSAMVVVSYLIRMEPFVRSYLILQGGKFDHADRLFYSIAKTWNSASRDNTSDVRELTPEFYYLPEFLNNSNNFDLGALQDGTKVSDVQLPPWAHGSAEMFVKKMRQALESPYVSEHLPQWIDLVFGYKQNGQEAVDATNVFHHLSYAGAIDLDNVKDEREKSVVIATIHNFGQTPLKIFSKPHPQRGEVVEIFDFDQSRFSPVSIVSKKSLADPVDQIFFDAKAQEWRPLPPHIRTNGHLKLRKYSSCNLVVNESLMVEQLSNGKITQFEIINSKNTFIVGFDDGTLGFYELTADPLNNITNSQRSSVQYVRPRASTASASCLMLQNLDVLRGSKEAIKEIKVSSYNEMALTLSISGQCILWDLAKHDKMKDVSTDERLISISDEDGYIATVNNDNKLKLLSVNSNLVYTTELAEGSTVVEFAESNLPFAPHLHNEPWRQILLLAVGFENGAVEIYELRLASSWSLVKVGEFKVLAKVTAVKLKLEVALSGGGIKEGRAQLLVGDENGDLTIWS